MSDRPLRIVLTGSECTGKTTLARHLAAHFGVRWVPEYVREFVDAVGRAPEFEDHGPIARGQMAAEDAALAHAAEAGEPFVIQDTDLLSTVVYSGHYFGHAPEWIADTVRARRPDLYLLCEIDLPWVADGQRDRGHLREEMQQLFRDAVAATGVPFVVIRGSGPAREQAAIDAIDVLELLRDGSA